MRAVTLPFAALMLILAGCTRPPKVSPPFKPTDPWALVTVDTNGTEPALLWNGQIGARIARDGSLTDLGSYCIDSYSSSGEEKIRRLPSLSARLWRNKLPFNLSERTDYRQEISLRDGILLTRFKIGDESFTLTTLLHPSRPVFTQRWELPGKMEEWGFVAPVELSSISGPEGKPYRTNTNLTEDPMNPGRIVAEYVCQPIDDKKTLTHQEIRRAAELETERRKKIDIQIDGPIEDQLAVRSMLHYLRTAISPNGKMSISPFGLSNDLYNGHVFWDADIWVFPALALLEPERAARIPAYRMRTMDQAEKNFQQWVDSMRPTGSKELGPLDRTRAFGGVKFAWESSVTGKETVPGPSKFEDHITGDVAWSARLASSLALLSKDHADDLEKKASTFYWTRSIPRPDGTRSITGTMSPDENHIGDNDLYTNLVAQWATNGGTWTPKTINQRSATTYHLPKDDLTFLTYENDALRGYKQAAAVLSIYPLQYPPAEKQAAKMMERFADKVTPNGPAMSDAIHATIYARLGETEKAYQTWLDSWQDFTTSPLMLFSEKRNKPRTYFTTGAGGCLQTVLYGFLGIRIDYKAQAGAAWSHPLKEGRILSIKPNIPKAWKGITVRGLSILGRRYDVVADHKSVRVTPQTLVKGN